MRYLLVSIDNANAPDVAHVVSEFYLGYGVDDADVPGVHVRELAADVPAELERERTQNLALRHSVPSLVREVRLSGAARSTPFTEALEEVERAWAALSTQEESKPGVRA